MLRKGTISFSLAYLALISLLSSCAGVTLPALPVATATLATTADSTAPPPTMAPTATTVPATATSVPPTATPPSAVEAQQPREEAVCPFSADMDCAVCHEMQPYVDSLENTELSAYTHAQLGYTCVDCHDEGNLVAVHEPCPVTGPVEPREASMDDCFVCHLDWPTIVAQTSGPEFTQYGINPHDTHLGEIDCSTCHSIHSTSERLNICWTCHHGGPQHCSQCH